MATETVATPAPESSNLPQPTGYLSSPIGLIGPTFNTFKIVALPLLAIAGIIFGIVSAFAIVGFMVYFAAGDARNIAIIGYGVVALLALMYASLYTSWMSNVILLAGARGKRVALKDTRPSSFGQVRGYFWTNRLAGIFRILGRLVLIVSGIILSV